MNETDMDGFIALHKAVDAVQNAAVKILIKANADVNNNGGPDNKMTPLIMAAIRSDPKIVKELISAEADVNFVSKQRSSPLREAVNAGNSEIVDLLIEAKVDLHGFQFSKALHGAYRRGYGDIGAALLEALEEERAKERGDNVIVLPHHLEALKLADETWEKVRAGKRRERALLKGLPQQVHPHGPDGGRYVTPEGYVGSVGGSFGGEYGLSHRILE